MLRITRETLVPVIWKVKPILKWEIDSIQAVLDEEKEKQGESDQITGEWWNNLLQMWCTLYSFALWLFNWCLCYQQRERATGDTSITLGGISRNRLIPLLVLFSTAKRNKRRSNDSNAGNRKKRQRIMSNQPSQGKENNLFTCIFSLLSVETAW